MAPTVLPPPDRKHPSVGTSVPQAPVPPGWSRRPHGSLRDAERWMSLSDHGAIPPTQGGNTFQIRSSPPSFRLKAVAAARGRASDSGTGRGDLDGWRPRPQVMLSDVRARSSPFEPTCIRTNEGPAAFIGRMTLVSNGKEMVSMQTRSSSSAKASRTSSMEARVKTVLLTRASGVRVPHGPPAKDLPCTLGAGALPASPDLQLKGPPL